ncbi:MAG TPA: DUF2339 domain-containing protein [Candidatus Polarisedimenticolaceae bacterium]|nr:DUF2339 domain-containing protein [Candidatus Polarisedimenticolaceae bacterium]
MLYLVVAAFFVIVPIVALLLALNAIVRVTGRGPGSIEKRLEALEAALKNAEGRLRKVERPLAGDERATKEAPGVSPPRVAPQPAAAAEPTAAPPPRPAAPAQPAAAPPAPPARVAPPLPPPSASARPAPASPLPPTRSLEERIGARWATWIGVIAIVISAGLLLRYAFDRNIIGFAGRVALGLAAGFGMLVAGFAVRRRATLPYLALGLQAGGLAILYAALFAGYGLYHLFSTTTAFGALFAVTLTGSALAAATGELPLAILAVLGGLVTPVVVGGERADERMLFGYLVVLDLLALAVSRFRAWPALNRLAWAGSAVLVVATLVRAPAAPHPIGRLALLSALAAVFVALPLLRAWLDRSDSEPLDLLLVVVNGALYFGAVYVTLETWRPALEGPWAVALAALYFAVGAFHRRRVPGDDLTPAVHYGAAAVLVALAVPLALDGPWVTMAWAAQAVVLVFVAPRAPKTEATLGAAAILFAAAIVRAVSLDPQVYARATPVLNVTALVGFAVVAALALAGRLASRAGEQGALVRSSAWVASAGLLAAILARELTRPWDTLAVAIEGIAILLLARTVISSEALVGAGRAILALATVRSAGLAIAPLPGGGRPHPAAWNAFFAVHIAVVAALGAAGALSARAWRTAFWTGAALLLAVLLWTELPGVWPAVWLTLLLVAVATLGRVQGDRAFRIATVAVAAIALLRLFAHDAKPAAEAATSLFNSWLFARVAASLAVAYAGRALGGPERPPLLGLAWVQLLAALSLGWFLHHDALLHDASSAGAVEHALRWRMQLGLSVLWAVYAGGSLALGLAWSAPALRYASLGLLGITVVKVFLLDLSEVQTVYRVLSFLVLGLVLLAVSVLYQRRLGTEPG